MTSAAALPRHVCATVEVSWDGTGLYDGAYDDLTANHDVAADPGVTIECGKDGSRSLSPPRIETGAWALDNEDGRYSPEQPASPLYQLMRPGLPARISAGTGTARAYRSATAYRARVKYRGVASYRLFTGRLEDIAVSAGLGDRRADMTAVGLLGTLVGRTVSIPVQQNIRTDEAVTLILDAVGWPAASRDIATGDSLLTWWWADERSAYDALVELVASEGPGALWVDGSGVLHFENRGYRAIADRSTDIQAIYYDRRETLAGPYRAPHAYRAARAYRGQDEALWFTKLTYEPGYTAIRNRATYTTRQRTAAPSPAVVWTYGADLLVPTGAAGITLIARPTDPFIGAVTPAAGTDYTVSGGTVTVTMAAASGFVAFITIVATSGTPTVAALQLRAQPLLAAGDTTIQSTIDASSSIETYGEQTLAVAGWPEIGPATASAVCDAWVSRYQRPRPIVTVTLRNADGAHVREMLDRITSDRIRVVERTTGLNADLWVESKRITIAAPHGRVVECELRCEQVETVSGDVWGPWPSDEGVWDVSHWGR